MRSYKRYFTLLMMLVCVSVLTHAQISFSVHAPRQVVQGDKFRVTYELKNAEGNNLRVGDIDGCTLTYGPSTSTSYSQQWINGVSSSSSSTSYTYNYRADKAGKYNVKGGSINVNGKSYSTNGFTIEVLPPDKSVTQGGNQSQGVQINDASSQSSSNEVKSSDIFVRINLSKSKAYEQEAIVCTIKLYTKYQISQFMATLQPSFNGFLIEELPIVSQLNAIEHVNGQNYMTAELKKCILYPQQSGKLTITSGNYDVSVVQYEEYRSMFGMMRRPVEKKLKVKSNSGSININPLPEPKPADFNGAVGEFSIKSTLNTDKFKTNEAATYTFTITGTGNVKYVKSPEIQFPSQFEVYDPQTNISATPNGGDMTGSSKTEYTFVPQYVGDFSIPAVNFSYFNPKSGKYVKLVSDGFNIKVAKGIGVSSAQAADKKMIEQKNKDILHIKTGDLDVAKVHDFYISEFSYWMFYIVPFCVVVFIMIYNRKTLKERANVQMMRTKRANKVAMKRLKLAKQFMQQHDSNKFYAEVLKAMWGYLSDKLGIPVSMLNKENIESELTNYGATPEVIAEVIRVLDQCEFAQYAPAQSDAEMETVYKSTADTMDKLENTKKKN